MIVGFSTDRISFYDLELLVVTVLICFHARRQARHAGVLKQFAAGLFRPDEISIAMRGHAATECRVPQLGKTTPFANCAK
jgi:hypothetical protein